MTEQERLEELRYPVGRFQRTEQVEEADLLRAMSLLAEFPSELRNAVRGLDTAQLGTPYREGGWTVRQVVHHVADSHSMALIRVKLSLTEDWPAVPAYDEAAWARLADGAGAPVEWSLELIESVHARWVMLLQTLRAEQWARGAQHPERGRQRIDQMTVMYGWHSRHHLQHIVRLRQREGW